MKKTSVRARLVPDRNGMMLILLLLVIGFAVFYVRFYFYPAEHVCDSRECFDSAMVSCSRGASFIDEQDKATWKYVVAWKDRNLCDVQVTLLLAKSGPLGLSALEGRSMNCNYQFGVKEAPGADLSKCQGYLKEGLQDLIIKKLYQYVIGNIDQIKNELNPVG